MASLTGICSSVGGWLSSSVLQYRSAFAVAGICTSVGGSLSSGVLQYRSSSDEGLDDRVPPSPSAAVAFSGEFSSASPNTWTFAADTPDRNSYPLGKQEGLKVCGTPRVVHTVRLSRTVLIEEERTVFTCIRASRNLAEESWHEFQGVRTMKRTMLNKDSNLAQGSWHDSPRRGFASGKELPCVSTSGHGNTHTPSASITSEAIAILKHRQEQGLSINSYMIVDILKRCSRQRDLIATRQVHDYIYQRGMQKHPYVANTLLSVYVKCDRLQDARRVFDGLKSTKRDVITWNVMIGGYAKSGFGMEAYRLFLQMRTEGFIADAFTYASILNPAASAGPLVWVREVHGHAQKQGLESNLRVGSALVRMYGRRGSIHEARLAFDRMEERDVITWNIMIGAYAESGSGIEAYRLFLQMKREGFVADAFTYASILNPSASVGALEWVREVHCHARKQGLESNLRVGSAFVRMYGKSGCIDDARLVFDRMEERDVITWNIMIRAYAESGRIDDARLVFGRMGKRDAVTWNIMIGGLAVHGYGEEALKLFKEMIADGVKPDETLFVAVLSACSHAGLVDDGRRIFSAMIQDYGIEPTVIHYNCMVDILGRAGRLEESKLLIENMPFKPDAVTWTTLLAACRTYSNVEVGEFAAKEVLKLEPKDAAAYVVLSNIYAAAGKWDKVSSVRSMMQERGVPKQPGRSWIEVDNKIHEFLVGDTSHPEAKAIYSELKELNEQLKAIGYIPDTKLVLLNVAEEEKELALCSHSEKLAIAYGLLHVPSGKPIRVQKNLRVCLDCHLATKLMSEVTGREIIVRDANRFHHFKDGVCSCGDYW